MKQKWSVVRKQWSVVRPRRAQSRRGQWQVEPSPFGRGQGEGADFRRLPAPCTLPPAPCPLRRAFTLAELLIVVAIVVLVSIATVPLVRSTLDTRRIRESGRLVSTQFASAQSEALANGRSAGVWLERMTNEPTASMDLFLCTVPQPYAGDSESSVANVTVNGGVGAVTVYSYTAVGGSTDVGWEGLLRPGDLIRFNYSGPYYSLAAQSGGSTVDANGYLQPPTGNANTVFSITPVDPDDFTSTGAPAFRHLPPAAFTAAGWTTPFQIFEQPVKESNVPVQLPAGDVVDLNYSGMSGLNFGMFGSPTSGNSTQPIIVMFDRSGAVDSLYLNGAKQAISGPLYFLVGKRDELASLSLPPGVTQDNLNDLENVWVAVNPQTGLVTTAEVASGGSVSASRAFATSAQSMGGK